MAFRSALPPDFGRIAELRLRELAVLAGSLDGVERISSLVLTVATITEAFVEAVLRELILVSSCRADDFGSAMYAELEDSIFQSWGNRHSWLDKGFGIKIAGTAAAQELQVLIDLRNALVHGAGRLTDRQTRDIGHLVVLEAQLRKLLAVDVERGRVNLTPSTGRKCIDIARAYILALDKATREAWPKVAI